YNDLHIISFCYSCRIIIRYISCSSITLQIRQSNYRGNILVCRTDTQRRSSAAAGAGEAREGNPTCASKLGGRLQRLVSRLLKTTPANTGNSTIPGTIPNGTH